MYNSILLDLHANLNPSWQPYIRRPIVALRSQDHPAPPWPQLIQSSTIRGLQSQSVLAIHQSIGPFV